LDVSIDGNSVGLQEDVPSSLLLPHLLLQVGAAMPEAAMVATTARENFMLLELVLLVVVDGLELERLLSDWIVD
jgi:hypothetical protein